MPALLGARRTTESKQGCCHRGGGKPEGEMGGGMGWKLGSLEKRTRSAPNIYKHPPMHTTNTPSDEPHPRMGDKKRMGEEGGMG